MMIGIDDMHYDIDMVTGEALLHDDRPFIERKGTTVEELFRKYSDSTPLGDRGVRTIVGAANELLQRVPRLINLLG